MKRFALIGFILLTTCLGAVAGDNVRFWGYFKDLRTFYFDHIRNDLYIDNLMHNRLNFNWYINSDITFDVEIRNRLHYGNLMTNTPDFSESLGAGQDAWPLDWIIYEGNSVVFHTMIDRIYLDFAKQKWELRLGRQRINWGLNLVWNPNDIFNTYNFYDFDYEERPGADAIRFQYYTGMQASIDIAINYFTEFEEMVAAALYRFNAGLYDWQVMAGVTNGDLAAGGGWAGNIKQWGFKGEFTYFYDLLDREDLKDHAISLATSFDYSFSNGLYVNGSYLFNSQGVTEANLLDLIDYELSARSLSIYKHSLFAQISYPFSPIFYGAFSVIYNPAGDNAMFMGPVLTVSIAQNWDLDLIAQIYLARFQEKYQNLAEYAYLRVKYSF